MRGLCLAGKLRSVLGAMVSNCDYWARRDQSRYL